MRGPVIRLFITALLLIPVSAQATWINKKGGVSLPETDARKSVSAFNAEMIFVENERALFAGWLAPAASVNVSTINTTVIGKGISAFIIFGGCKPDSSGNCNVTMQFRVVRPDGEVYGAPPELEVWQGKPAPKGKSLELSIRYMKIIIEPKDQLGDYIVYANVKDENAGTSLKLKAPFTATK